MARTKNPARLRAILGDPVVTFARTRVPLDQPLPPPYVNVEERTSDNPGNHPWRDFVDVLENAPGCSHIGYSRVAEDPETVIFVITWWDQESLDRFKQSPDYAVFLVALGMLDFAEGDEDGASSPPPPGPSRRPQTVKFLGGSATYWIFLSGWISLYTVTLPHPVTDEQRELYLRLSGPRHPRFEMGTDEWIKLAAHVSATVPRGLYHGWAQEPRQVRSERGENLLMVQDAIFYKKWKSREAEEALKTAVPGVKMDWDDELRKIGAVDAKEEHVEFLLIGLGLQPRGVTLPAPAAGP